MSDTYMKRTEVRIVQQFDAPPARIFRAWTVPEEMVQWMWGSMSKEVWAEVDLRVGGAYRVYTKSKGVRIMS